MEHWVGALVALIAGAFSAWTLALRRQDKIDHDRRIREWREEAAQHAQERRAVIDEEITKVNEQVNGVSRDELAKMLDEL